MARLAPNFTRKEFELSQIAVRRGIINKVPADLMPNLQRLAETMQKIRDFLGHPVVITSGYRSMTVNRLVGGARTSHHIQAGAADWICPGFGTTFECCEAIESHLDQFGITQLIHEYGRWVHVSILPITAPINQVITIDHGIPSVRPGIHPARKT